MTWTAEEQRLIDETARNIEMFKKWEQIYSWTVQSAEEAYLKTKSSLEDHFTDAPFRNKPRQRTTRFVLKDMYKDIPGFWDFAETLDMEQFRLCKEYYIMHQKKIRSLNNPLQHIKNLLSTNRIREEIYKLKMGCEQNSLDN